MRTILTNGIIYHGRQPTAKKPCSSMVINDGLVEYLGDNPARRIPELVTESEKSEVIDLDGSHVFPAFIDGHMHILQFGASLVKIGLDDCKNLSDIRHTISTAAQAMPNAKRILCRGWRQEVTEREALASMIDDLDPRPIYIDSDDLHSIWCNTAALTEMGLDRNTPDPVGGSLSRDEDGNPSGLVSEGAVFIIVWPFLMSVMTRQDRIDAILAGIHEYHASGYVGVVEMAMDREAWDMLKELHHDGRLGLRMAAHWLIAPRNNEEEHLAQVQEAIELHKQYNLETSPDFRIAGIKVIADGVIDSCTAAVSQPYLVPPYGLGDLAWPAVALEPVAAKADAAGLQIAIHAIGDTAINIAINTLEGLGTKGRRHRIEHLELTHPDDAKRLGALGITASVQPVHSDPTISTAWPEIIGQERCEWAFAYRHFHDHGAQMVIGTDSPTAPHQPFPNLYVGMTRESSRELQDHHQLNKILPLTLVQAWSAATWGAAYSCFAESTVGSLEVGKKADFILVDGISKTLDSKSLLTAQVMQTWKDGRKIYSR